MGGCMGGCMDGFAKVDNGLGLILSGQGGDIGVMKLMKKRENYGVFYFAGKRKSFLLYL
jgi:hypothetical protein